MEKKQIKNMLGKLLKTGICIVVLFIFISCEKESGPVEYGERNLTSSDVYHVMKQWYLWNTTIPEEDISMGLSPEETLETLRFKELDRWSFISPSTDFTQMFDYGKYIGYGFGHTRGDDGKERIRYVFRDSDLNQAGVKRGWQLVSVDGVTISEENTINKLLAGDEENTIRMFSFIDNNNSTQQIAATKKEIDINTVLFSGIFDIDGKKTGYIVFQSFLETSADELTAVFKDFKSGGITHLILDLRYNSGGRTSISKLIGNLVAGDQHNGKVLTNYVFNEDRSNKNFSETLSTHQLSVDIDMLVFITSGETASASELLINGLKPFLDVFVIGEKTSGKPVGMNQWIFKDKALIPVTFKTANALGEGEYYNGIEVDYRLGDDLSHSFGDPMEANLKEAIHLIANGEFSPPVESTKSVRIPKKAINNLYDYFGAY